MGTQALCIDPWLAEKCLSQSSTKAWKQSQGEMQKPTVLSDQLKYTMLKGYYGIFAWWHQKINRLPQLHVHLLTNYVLFEIICSAEISNSHGLQTRNFNVQWTDIRVISIFQYNSLQQSIFKMLNLKSNVSFRWNINYFEKLTVPLCLQCLCWARLNITGQPLLVHKKRE